MKKVFCDLCEKPVVNTSGSPDVPIGPPEKLVRLKISPFKQVSPTTPPQMVRTDAADICNECLAAGLEGMAKKLREPVSEAPK
jgi:hypothetical protein